MRIPNSNGEMIEQKQKLMFHLRNKQPLELNKKQKTKIEILLFQILKYLP